MEKEQTAKRLMPFAETQASVPSSGQLNIIKKWVAIFMEHHHKEISELGMVAYIEGLKDLSPAEINHGCERALKEVDHMPTVAHIRERCCETLDVYSGVPEYEAPLSAEERKEAAEAARKNPKLAWLFGPPRRVK